MLGFPEPLFNPNAFLIKTATGGTFVINSKDLSLYQDCYVIWTGRVTNVNSNEKYFNADLLVGYEDMKKIDGIAHLRISSEISVNPEKPLKVLGKISIEDGSLILLGKAIYQPLTGDKL